MCMAMCTYIHVGGSRCINSLQRWVLWRLLYNLHVIITEIKFQAVTILNDELCALLPKVNLTLIYVQSSLFVFEFLKMSSHDMAKINFFPVLFKHNVHT